MKRLNEVLFDAANMASNQTSKVLNLGDIYTLSLHYQATGSAPGGTLTWQGSNAPTPFEDGTDVTGWATIGTPVSFSGTANAIVNLDGQAFKWFRAIYATAGGSSGALTVWFNGKGA